MRLRIPGRELDRGIAIDGACKNRNIEIYGNFVKLWPRFGIRLVQCLGVDSRCNNLENDQTGFDFSATLTDTTSTTLRQNRIAGSAERAFRTDHAEKVRLGPWSSDRGRNELETPDTTGTSPRFITQNDPNGARILQAQQNAWRVVGHEWMDATSEIKALIDGVNANNVNVDNPQDPDLVWGWTRCYPGAPPSATRPPGSGIVDAALGRDEVLANVTTSSQTGIPSVTELGVAKPSPFRTRTSLQLAVAGAVSRSVRVDVFDVQGRKVRELVWGTLAPGRYDLHWDGRDGRSRSVVAGVYFVRALIGDIVATERVVLLR